MFPFLKSQTNTVRQMLNRLYLLLPSWFKFAASYVKASILW